MKAAIISLGSESSKMTAEAMAKFFDEVDMIQLREVEVVLGKEAGVYYQGKHLPDYDCIYIKGSFRYAHLLRSITSLLENKVPYIPLPSNSFTVVHNKLLTHLALEQKEIPMPRTYVSPTANSARELLEQVSYPIVMKFPEGTQGKGVMFADSFASASSLLDALGALNQPFIIQEYVESGGTDIRVLVVGDKAIAAMQRRAKEDEKRANLHAGGTGEGIPLTREIANLAVRTARALNAGVCGVDILVGPFGPMVIEANISPGLQGLCAAHPEINIPTVIAKHFYQKTLEIVNKNKETAGKNVMEELNLTPQVSSQELITNLKFRGDKIVLPELITRITKFSELHNYKIRAKKGRLEIEEFGM
jgi:ribosomal protein S6--L-glutamate ligase